MISKLGRLKQIFNRLHEIENLANNRKALIVDTQSIESTFTEEYTENTETDIITPSSGNRIAVKDVSIHTKATSGIVKLDFNGKKVARLYSSVNNRFNPLVSSVIGDIDESLHLETTTGSNEVFVVVNYIEVEG